MKKNNKGFVMVDEDSCSQVKAPSEHKHIRILTMGTIRGRVTGGKDGSEPLKDIDVTFYSEADGLASKVASVSTDINGNYAIHYLLPGEYRVVSTDKSMRHAPKFHSKNLSKEDFSIQHEPISPIMLPSSIRNRYMVTSPDSAFEDNNLYRIELAEGMNDINVSLDLAGHIQGTVTSHDGITPLNNISVSAYRYLSTQIEICNHNLREIASVETDSDGSYRIRGLIPGFYRIGFSDPSEKYLTQYYKNQSRLRFSEVIDVAAGKTITGINASLKTAFKGSIEGKLTDITGNPLKDINYHHSIYINSKPHTAKIDFCLDNLDNREDNYVQNSDTYKPIFQSGSTADSDVDFSLGGHIQGRIFDVNGNKITCGYGSFINIYALRWNGSEWYEFSNTITKDGFYDIGGLPSGTYRILFEDELPRKYISQYYNKQNTLDSATDVYLKEGDNIVCIDAYLSLKGIIKGKVTGPDGVTPLEGIYVSVYSKKDNVSGDAWTCRDSVGATDLNGNYTVKSIDSEICRVEFMDIHSGKYTKQYYNKKNTLDSADELICSTNSILRDINVSLSPAGFIEGTFITRNQV